jgi:hypothetical protein
MGDRGLGGVEMVGGLRLPWHSTDAQPPGSGLGCFFGDCRSNLDDRRSRTERSNAESKSGATRLGLLKVVERSEAKSKLRHSPIADLLHEELFQAGFC